jgi:hypothetical protein
MYICFLNSDLSIVIKAMTMDQLVLRGRLEEGKRGISDVKD